MNLGSRHFIKYRKVMVLLIVLMFFGSTIPTTMLMAGRGNSRKEWKSEYLNFDLNETLDSAYETYKDYQALEVKIENLDDEINELLILTNKGVLAGLDTAPYYNKKDVLKDELADLDDELADTDSIIKRLRMIRADLNSNIEEKLKEINKTEYRYLQYTEKLDALLDKLVDADTYNPVKIDELSQMIMDILIQLEFLVEIYKCRSALDMNTTELEQQIDELSAQYYLLSTQLQVLLDEPHVLESKIEKLLVKLLKLETILEVLYNDLDDLEEQSGRVNEGIKQLMTMINGNTILNKVLSKIEDKAGRLNKNLEKIYKKRDGSKKDTPEPKIESELVPLKLPGMTNKYAVIKLLVTDELTTSDPRENGENCLLQISKDGKTWYPLELDLVSKDGFYFGYLANKAGKYWFKASMSNWYGNLGYDTDTVVYRGTEPYEELEPEVSVANVSFNYWYDGFKILCANQQQLGPSSNSNELKSSSPSKKDAYQRSFVSYQDGDDIIAVGYAETNPNAAGPLHIVSGDSFSALETSITKLGNLQYHQFVAIPPYDDAPMVIIDSKIGIIETINKDPDSASPGSTTTHIESDVVLLNTKSDKYVDWDYEISFRTNISYFEDPTSNNNSNRDTGGINETEAELEFNFTAENNTSEGSVLASKLNKFSKRIKTKFNKWKQKTKLGNDLKSTIGKFAGKVLNIWNQFSGKLGKSKSQFKDRITFKFKGLSHKWLSLSKGLWGKFSGKYKDLFEETNSTFSGLLSRLDFNVSKKTGEDVKNFCGGLIKKISSKVKEAFKNKINKIKKTFNKIKLKSYSKSHSKAESWYESKINKSFKKISSYTKLGGKLKKEMDRTMTGTTKFSGLGVIGSKSHMSGKWSTKGREFKDNETKNNKEFNYDVNQILLTLPETDQDDPIILYETIDLAIDIEPPEPPKGNENLLNPDAPRIAVISYELNERPIVQQDDSGLNDISTMYDTISLNFLLKDVTYEDTDWISEDSVSTSMSRSSVLSSYVTSGLNSGPNINIDMSNLWPEMEGSYDITEEMDLLETIPTDDLVIYEGHGRYPGGPDFDVTQDMLDNLTCVFVMDFDQVNEFNEESENGSAGRDSYGNKLYNKGKSWVKNSINKAKSWAKGYYNKGRGLVNKGKSLMTKSYEKGKEWANNYYSKGKGFMNKGKDWVQSAYENGKEWSNSYIGKAKGFINNGKEWANGAYEKGKSIAQGYMGKAKGIYNKGQSWAKNKWEQGKSWMNNNSKNINDTRISDSTSSNTDETTNSIIRSDLNQNIVNGNMNGTSRSNDTNYKIINQLTSEFEHKKGPRLFIARAYHREGFDEEPYVDCLIGDDENDNNTGSSMTYLYTHLLQYDDLGQLQAEDLFGHETSTSDYAWWGKCNGWSSAALIEPEPHDPIGGRNNTEFYKWSTTEIARLDPEVLGQLSRASNENETETTVVTGREIGYIQTVESSSNPDLLTDGKDNGCGHTTKSTEFYQTINIQPGFYVPDLQISSDRIDDPDDKDKIIDGGSDDPAPILKSVSMNMIQTIEGNKVNNNSTNKFGAAGVLRFLEPFNQNNQTDEELQYVYILHSLYEPDKTFFDPVKAAENNNRITGLIEKPILKLRGTVDGELDESFGIDLEGSITVQEDFTKQFGRVKATLQAGGNIGVKVTKNKFKYAELSGLKVDAKVTVGEKDLKLQGGITGGKYNHDYSLDFYGGISVTKDFSKQFGENVKVSLKAGGKLGVKVNKSEFQYAEVGPTCLMNVSIGEQTLKLEGMVDGKIDEDFKIDLDGEIRVLEDFSYKKDNVSSVLTSGASLGAKVTANKFKSADLNLTCDANITIPSINESKLKLNGAIEGKYKSGRIDFNSKLSTEDDFSYGRDKVIADLRSGGVVKPKVESNKFRSASFGGIQVDLDIEFGDLEDFPLLIGGDTDSENLDSGYRGTLKLATIIGVTLKPKESVWGDDPIPNWGTNTRIDAFNEWINGFIGGIDDETPEPDPSPDDNNSEPDDNNTDPNNGNNTNRTSYSDITSLSTNIERYVDNYNSLRKYSQSNINESMTMNNQMNFKMVDDDSLLYSMDLQSYYKTQLSSQPYKWWLPKRLMAERTSWAEYSGWGTAVDITSGDDYEIDMDADLTSLYMVDSFGLIDDGLGTYYPDNDTLYPRMTKGELISKINSKTDIKMTKKSSSSDSDSDDQDCPDDMSKEDLINSIDLSIKVNHSKVANFTDYYFNYRDDTRGDNASSTSRHNTEYSEYGLVSSYSQKTIDDTTSADLDVITDSNIAISGTNAFDVSQSYWTYWHWFDQITKGWTWDDEISTERNPYSEKDIRLGFDKGKQKLSASSGSTLGSSAYGKVEVEVDVSKIGDVATNTGKVSVDSDSDGKLELSDPNKNETKTVIWKSSVSSGITAEDDWEAPNAVVDSFFDVSFSTDNSNGTNSSVGFDPNIALELLNIVSIDLGDIAVGMDRENSIECIMDTRLIVEKLFPSGPAKGIGTSYSETANTIKRNTTTLISGERGGIDPNMALELLNVVTIDIGDVALGMDRENSIECLIASRLLVDKLFPSGPAKLHWSSFAHFDAWDWRNDPERLIQKGVKSNDIIDIGLLLEIPWWDFGQLGGSSYSNESERVSSNGTRSGTGYGSDPNMVLNMMNVVSVDLGNIALGLGRADTIESYCSYEYVRILDEDHPPSGDSEGAAFNFVSRLSLASGITAEDDWEAPTAIFNIVSVNIGDIAVDMDRENSIECIMDTRLIVDDLFPSGPAKGAAFYSDITIDLDRAGQVTGVGQSQFIDESYFDVSTSSKINIPDGSEVSGVEPSPFYIGSTVKMASQNNVQNTTGDDGGVGQSPFLSGSNTNAIVSFIIKPGGDVMGVEPSPFRFCYSYESAMNYIFQPTTVDNSNEGENYSDNDHDDWESTKFNTEFEFKISSNSAAGGSSRDSNNENKSSDIPVMFNPTKVSIKKHVEWKEQREDKPEFDYNNSRNITSLLEIDSQIEFITGGENKVMVRAYDRLHRLTRGRESRTWEDRDNGSDNNSKIMANSFSKTSFESEFTVMFNPENVSIKKSLEWNEEKVKNKRDFSYFGLAYDHDFNIDFGSDDNNTMIIRGFDKFHRLSRGTDSSPWGDGINGTEDNSAITLTVLQRIELSNLAVRNLDNSSEDNDEDDGLSPDGTTDDSEYSTNSNQQSTRGDTYLSRNKTTPMKNSIILKSETQINVMFNPNKLQFDKTVPWDKQKRDNNETPKQEFTSGSVLSFNVAMNYSTSLDKWTRTKRNYTNYYDNNSSEFRYVSNTALVFEGVTNQMSLMQTFSYSGMEMNKNNTTIAGNQYSSNTLLAVDSSTITLKTATNFSSFIDKLGGSSGNFNIDSFFDVFYEIPHDRENESTTITAGVQEVDFDLKISVYGDDEVDPLNINTNYVFSQKMVCIPGGSGGNFNIDSFFDIYYEIPPERENITVRSSIRQGLTIQGPSLQARILQGISIQGRTISGNNSAITAVIQNTLTRANLSDTDDDNDGSNDIMIIQSVFFNHESGLVDTHPDWFWMGSSVTGWGESEDDLNEGNDNSFMNYTKFRMVHVMRMNFSIIVGDDDNGSEIEMHADFMTKAELIGAVAGDINDSEDEQSSRSGETNGSRPPPIKHEIYMNYQMNFKITNTSNNDYELWKVGEFMTNIIANWDDRNRGAHDNESDNGNGSSNRIIISAWREFDSNRSYNIGININDKYLYDENNSITHSIIFKWSTVGPTTSFKVELNNNDDQNTFWCRVSSSMTRYDSSNNSIPDVDDEVDISIGQKYIGPEDSDLKYYSYNLLAENLTPGEDPDYLFNTIYRYTGNDSYYGDVNYYNETYNNGVGNGTNITIKLNTYKKSVDDNGNVVRELLYTDIIKINYAKIKLTAKDGTSALKETMTFKVERRDYGT